MGYLKEQMGNEQKLILPSLLLPFPLAYLHMYPMIVMPPYVYMFTNSFSLLPTLSLCAWEILTPKGVMRKTAKEAK